MNADIDSLYISGFYKIVDFRCRCTGTCLSKAEFAKSFNISFVRRGNFNYKVFRNNFDVYTGYAIIDKPGSEHIVAHDHHIPDECTIIDFSDEFYRGLRDDKEISYRQFFENPDVQSLLVKTDSSVEFLHYMLLREIHLRTAGHHIMDGLVFDILQWFLHRIDNRNERIQVSPGLKKRHLQTVETAKEFIYYNFREDISLADIASACCVSPFHFSRIFKSITGSSPWQFLLHTRLSNARQLVTTTKLPVNEISFLSGFQNVEHFNAAFRSEYHLSPSLYIKSKNS